MKVGSIGWGNENLEQDLFTIYITFVTCGSRSGLSLGSTAYLYLNSILIPLNYKFRAVSNIFMGQQHLGGQHTSLTFGPDNNYKGQIVTNNQILETPLHSWPSSAQGSNSLWFMRDILSQSPNGSGVKNLGSKRLIKGTSRVVWHARDNPWITHHLTWNFGDRKLTHHYNMAHDSVE